MGKLRIVSVLVLCLMVVPCFGDKPGRGSPKGDRERGEHPTKVGVCHFDEDTGLWHVINPASPALPAHLRHGDCELDDGVDCTTDICDAEAGCLHESNCDDGEACTVDTCDTVADECSFVPVECDDGDACNGEETCDAATGACVDGVAVECDDGDPCNGDETCDPATGDCVDGAPVECDDGDACNGQETCDTATGDCVGGVPLVCDDGELCTVDTCEADGQCSFVAIECDDGDACNGEETCDSVTGDCVDGLPVECGLCEDCEDGACVPIGECGDDSDCAPGALCVECACVPLNDDCLDAIVILSNDVVVVDLAGATTAASDPALSCFGDLAPDGSVWYVFTATDESIQISTCNSVIGADSVLGLFEVGDELDPCGSLSEITCSDDDCGGDGLSLLTAASLVVGTEYYLVVGAASPVDQSIYEVELISPRP